MTVSGSDRPYSPLRGTGWWTDFVVRDGPGCSWPRWRKFRSVIASLSSCFAGFGAEIAVVLGVSEHTVRRRLSRARQMLRSEIARLTDDDQLESSTVAELERWTHAVGEAARTGAGALAGSHLDRDES